MTKERARWSRRWRSIRAILILLHSCRLATKAFDVIPKRRQPSERMLEITAFAEREWPWSPIEKDAFDGAIPSGVRESFGQPLPSIHAEGFRVLAHLCVITPFAL